MSKFSDYKQMMKPRITMLVLVTSYLGFYLGLRSMNQYFFTIEQVLLFVHLMIGTFLTASGASVLNQVIEKDHDAKMKRTKNRPIPSGRIDWRHALNFGVILFTSYHSTLPICLYTQQATQYVEHRYWINPRCTTATGWVGRIYGGFNRTCMDTVWHSLFLADSPFHGHCHIVCQRL